MTPYEWWCTYEGFRIKERKEWEHTRWISYVIFTGNGGKTSIEQFLPITPEEQEAHKPDKPLTRDEANKIIQQYKKIRKPQ